MSSRPLRKMERKPVLRDEDLAAALAQLREGLADAGARLAEATAASPGDSRPPVAVPDLSDRAEQALRELLEEETYALVEPDGPRGIAANELHHELLKKALVSLKTAVLKDIARSRGMDPENRLDDLARQVAASYQWDETAIARLLLDYAEDPPQTLGGPTTRVFPLKDPIDIARIADRLSYVDGRYYRTDIAKWFTFEKYQRVGTVLKVSGSVQTYRAGVDPVAGDRLKAEQDLSRASLDVSEGSRTARVHDATNASAARSMMAAFRVATTAQALNYVPNSGSGADIRPRALHPTTEFVLDLVVHRLQGRLFRQRDPILARFRLTRAEAGATTDHEPERRSRKPTLRAVRFEGKNLLDVPAACTLMWTEGRPLVDLTLEVAVTAADDDPVVLTRIPVRLALERDHVLVATGLSSDPKMMALVHRAAVDHVEQAIAEGVPADKRARLARIIRERAENPDPEADAKLLDDDADRTTT